MNALLQKLAALDSAPAKKEQALPPLCDMPSAEQYAAASRARAYWFLLGGGMLAALVASSFVGFGLDNIFLPIAILIGVLMPILLWRYPRLIFYGLLAGVCLFELSLSTGPDGMPYHDSLTDQIPLFWNVNTIFQHYAHINFKGIPLNLVEILLLVAGTCSCLHAVYTQNTSLRAGPLWVPICVYMAFVLMGWINGMATGGDFKISLQEVRSQFYFGVAYLMAVNMVRERKQLTVMLWIVVGCIGLKGILYTFRRYVTLSGLPLPDQGVGSHEESFFFDCFAALLIVLSTCGVYPKLRWIMLAFLPFVIFGSLVCNRRAGTAAFIIIVPLLVLGAYQALPTRRRLIGIVSMIGAVLFAGYYSAFKNSDSIIAQPARAIKSNFQPDARDASSNLYRDAENEDLMATIKSAPIQGYGYGKRMIHAVPIADISTQYEWWDIMTHNQVLWVWMRVGTFGFAAFWMMVSAVIICGCRTIQNPDADLEIKAIALFGVLVTGALMIFGLLDLQFSNFRDMLFVGLWSGVLAALPEMSTAPTRAVRYQRGLK
jgi:hypothetical protein